MSKLVFFLFLGVCVVAVHMAPANDEVSDDENDAALEPVVDSFQGSEVDARINIKKIWNKVKPVLQKIGGAAKPIISEAAKAAATAAAGKAFGG